MAADEWTPGELGREPGVTTAVVDRDADLETAFEMYRDDLFMFLLRSSRDAEVAADLLQDAFLRLARELDAGRRPDNVQAWLFRVGANLAISRARRGATVRAWLTRHGPTETRAALVESPEFGLLQTERRSRLSAALATVSADARTALVMSAQGFSGMEIAEAIGRSHNATRTLMFRARLMLREQLQAQDQEDRM